MQDNNNNMVFEQAAAFQKLWMDSCAKMAGAWSEYSPGSPPVEEVRKVRTGILKGLAEAWEEYMRTPQFMEAMKATLNGMLELRRLSRDGMNRLHEQFEIPTKEDIDGVLLAIRHIERRVLDRIEDIDERLLTLNEHLGQLSVAIKKVEEATATQKVSAKAYPETPARPEAMDEHPEKPGAAPEPQVPAKIPQAAAEASPEIPVRTEPNARRVEEPAEGSKELRTPSPLRRQKRAAATKQTKPASAKHSSK